MSTFKRAPVAGGLPKKDKLAPLRDVQLVTSKPILPAEIISTILDYLPVRDLFSFARVSKRMQEMVYDDTRWVQKLRIMGCWNEAEARRRVEDGMRKRWEVQRAQQTTEEKRLPGVEGQSDKGAPDTTIFDAGLEEKRQREIEASAPAEKLSAMSLSLPPPADQHIPPPTSRSINVIRTTHSVRGHARQAYGRIYGALAPFYFDIAAAQGLTDPRIFRAFQDPEQQAEVLAQLKVFAMSDIAEGWSSRERRLDEVMAAFENAALREFEQSFLAGDVDQGMRRYAHVLVALNGGKHVIELFIMKHPLFAAVDRLGKPMECIENSFSGNINLAPAVTFFERLSTAMNRQKDIINRTFPPNVDVMIPFLESVSKGIISEYITPLLDEAHARNVEAYLKAVFGIYEQMLRFETSLLPTEASGPKFAQEVNEILNGVIEPHLDLYLREELEFFKKKCEIEVGNWEKQLSEQDRSTESFFMANINRTAEKRDFLSSFKKVVMMPITALPAMPKASSTTTKSSLNEVTAYSHDSLNPMQIMPSPIPTRSPSPAAPDGRTTGEAPTTELAAKAAIMNSKLEGIKSLFSLEVALNLVHAAKASLERVALFVRMGGATGEEAKLQCLTIFVLLLDALGSRHIRPGFNTAVDHLARYNPREASSSGHNQQPGVAPLVTFLELVNVGDLIQQMVDVFYEQELVAAKLTDRNDFLDPAAKEKKKFEQMLDERVAAGLNKGIDVLLAEVEHLCASTQLPTDFNPPAGADANGVMDIGPSHTARQIVEVVSAHTRMLIGSTDKNMLDVFNQEVGLRLFAALCKHLKRQRVSVDGAIRLISDMNLYFGYVQTLRNKDLLEYFGALRELAQIYLISAAHAKEMATIIADGDRFLGIFRAEEVYEFAERRADWYTVKPQVEHAMYGYGCVLI